MIESSDRFTLVSRAVVALFALWIALAGAGGAFAGVSVIPLPNQIVEDPAAPPFVLTESTAILVQADNDAMRSVGEYLHDFLAIQLPGTAAPADFGGGAQPGGTILLTSAGADPTLGDEGYELEVNSSRVTIRASARAGAFYAVQTLRQLLPIEIEREVRVPRIWTVPHVTVTDRPAMAYRGHMNDFSRTFFPKPFVLRQLDLLALHKNNVFHLHLTDDQGWRIESKIYPQLHLLGGSWDPSAIDRRGEGYFTQQDLAEIIQYAEDRSITIIPEVDLPAHTLALMHVLPELACNQPRSASEFPVLPWAEWDTYVHEPICPAPESNYAILETILSEVAGLFPGPYFHIGSDEVLELDGWDSSAEVAALKATENLANNRQVEAYFTKRIEQILNANGKTVLAWNEAHANSAALPPNLSGLALKEGTVAMWWKDHGQNAAIFQAPYILTPELSFYYDLVGNGQTLPQYSFDPVVFIESLLGRPATQQEKDSLWGIQGTMWTNQPSTRDELAVEQLIYPSHAATSEVAWTEASQRNYADFQSRLVGHAQRLAILSEDYHDPAVNHDPVASIAAFPTAGSAPLEVQFDASASYDPNGDPITYLWDFGDGSQSQSSAAVSHSYLANGTYSARLTVSDPTNGTGIALQPITVGPPPDLGQGLVAYWQFDEGTGAVANDASGNDATAELRNGTGWVSGIDGSALSFDGIDDYADTGINTTLANWTVSLWVRSPAAPSDERTSGLVHREKNLTISWDHTNPLFRGAAALSVGGTWYAAGFGELRANTWYHLAATYDGEDLTTFVDGAPVTTNSAPSGPPDPEAASLKIGRHAVSENYFSGVADEVRVYDRALPDEQILLIFAGDSCDPDPCQNGSCVNQVRDYACSCDPGWEGVHCEIPTDECASQPCVNGSCTDEVDAYSCNCDFGWEGANCDVNIDDCASEPCVNGNCADELGGYTCSCDFGWEGANCDVNTDDCASEPCVNGSCADELGGYTCSCDFGWGGANCDVDIDDCAADPCENGSCVDLPGDFECACDPGWQGLNCEIDAANPHEGLVGFWSLDQTSGEFADDSSGNGLEGTLVGEPDWSSGAFGNGLALDGLDDYVDTPVATQLTRWTVATWVRSPESPGFGPPSGPVQRRSNFNINWNHVTPIGQGSASLRVGGVWYFASFGPLEADRWYHLAATYDGENLRAFTDGALVSVNRAPSGDPANETESLKLGRHARSLNFFAGMIDEVRVYDRPLSSEEIDTLTTLDACSAAPCANGSCSVEASGAECSCDPGWEGTHCEVNIDDCANEPCVNGTCNDRLGGYSCECDPGWQGNDCEIDIDDCANEPCVNGTCNDQLGGYSCDCDPGWQGNDCEIDIVDCFPSACQNGDCVDLTGDFECACDPGWQGLHCEIDSANPHEGLVGFWSLDQASGALADDASGNGFQGTLIGEPVWSSGTFGNGLDLDGNDDYVDTPVATQLDRWTVAAWVKSPAAPGFGPPSGPVQRRSNFNINWNHVSPIGQGSASLRVGGVWYFASFGPLEADRWYHLAATYDGENLRAFTDGALVSVNRAPSGDPASETESLKLGRHARSLNFFAGMIDEVRVYDRPLSSEEIDTLTTLDACSAAPCTNGSCGVGPNGAECTCDPGWSGVECTISVSDCLEGTCVFGMPGGSRWY